jgi:O-antigen/teichoic acid export membrane protein
MPHKKNDEVSIQKISLRPTLAKMLLKLKQVLIKKQNTRPKHRTLASDTLLMLLSQGVRLALQSAYFVIIARALGPEQYGAFVGATALSAILSPFSSLGSGNLLIKNVSRNPQVFREYWGNTLIVTFISGAFLTVIIGLFGRAILPVSVSPLLILVIAISDLLLARFIDIASQAFQAVHILERTAQINILLGVTRLLAALCLISFFPHPNAENWAYLYLGSTGIAAISGLILVHRILGSPRVAIARIQPEILEGFYFSLGLSAQTVYNDIDKTMLARMSSLEAVGIYAAAYRLVDVAFVPVKSLLAASYTKFFQQGATGVIGSLALSKRLTPIAASYGILAGLSLYFFAPIVPYIFGKEYEDTVNALQWLCLLPLLKSMHYFAADTLTGAGFQGVRSCVQVMIAFINVILNLWMIPRFSWVGAAWSSLASDGLLMVSLWCCVFWLHRKQVNSGSV